MTKLTLHAKELADAYALRTLYYYLREEKSPFEIELSGITKGQVSNFKNETLCDWVSCMPLRTTFEIENMLTPYSDIGGLCRGQRNMELDISILKNSVFPMTNQERMWLRQKYGVPSDRPVLAISYAQGTKFERALVEQCADLATIIFVGKVSDKMMRATFPQSEKSEHFLARTEFGIMKEIYALADVTVNSENFYDSHSELHNFVEATEGGPWFMVPSSRSQQYGFSELVQVGVIKPCRNAAEINERVRSYLENWDGYDNLRRFRAEHLKRTREKYLPVIHQYLKHYFLGEDAPQSDLVIDTVANEKTGRTAMRLSHPHTDWGCEPIHLGKPGLRDFEGFYEFEANAGKRNYSVGVIRDPVLDLLKVFASMITRSVEKINATYLKKSQTEPCKPAQIHGLLDFEYTHPLNDVVPLLDFAYTLKPAEDKIPAADFSF